MDNWMMDMWTFFDHCIAREVEVDVFDVMVFEVDFEIE